MRNYSIYFRTTVAFILLVFSGCKKPIISDGTIKGKITNAISNVPIEGADIYINNIRNASSDANGDYTLIGIPAQSQTVEARKTGFQTNQITVSVSAGGEVTGNIALTPIQPSIHVNSTVLDFGSIETQIAIEISNVGAGTLNWSISENFNWLSENPTSGSAAAQAAICIFSIDRSFLPAGQTSKSVIISSNGGSVTIAISASNAGGNGPIIIATDAATNVDFDKATANATISNLGSGGGAITDHGHCWSMSPNPTIANFKTTLGTVGSTGTFQSFLTGLNSNTTYYVKAYATNTSGTYYGNEVTLQTSILQDVDGYTYGTVTIGNQVWMVENLKTTKFANGDDITDYNSLPLPSGGDTSTLPMYMNYQNNSSYGLTYGKLYNGFAISDSRSVCPVGWHVPTEADFSTLITYLGGEAYAGLALKETGTIHWNAPNNNVTNNSGFTALPGGMYQTSLGLPVDLRIRGNFWSTASAGANQLKYLSLTNTDVFSVIANGSVWSQNSVRCIKN